MSSAIGAPIWSPKPEHVENAAITRFMKAVSEAHSRSISSYQELQQWSIVNPEAFWQEIWSFCSVIGEQGGGPVLENPDDLMRSRWFKGARLNFAENLLQHTGSRPALRFRCEDGTGRVRSFDELRHDAACIASWLKECGIAAGDRVAAFMPNVPETAAAMLGAASFGAVWSSCSPDFGIDGVFDRFGQIEPKVLFAADGYLYNGKLIHCGEKIAEIAERIPSIEHIVLVPSIGVGTDIGRKSTLWPDIVGQSSPPELNFERLPFNHPLYVLYSSGTTGVPKCIVHGAGGTLLQHLKELVLHVDLRQEDRIFYATTCGWMMWNWLLSSLAVGSTVHLYDGSPMHPDPAVLWDYCDAYDFTVFGTSAKYLSALEKSGAKPAETHRLASLRSILSTGSPLMPEQFDYVYRDIKQDLQLASITGGTDIVSLFAGGCPVLPVRRGELQCVCLGMDVKIFDEEGSPVIDQEGELVCTTSFPSKPIYFWNDPGGEKYHNAYFDRFDNVWCHGDWARITPHGGVIIYGRSDATLNPGGVRIGTADIYRQVEAFDEIQEALAAGQDWNNDVRIVLFVRMQPGHELDDTLRGSIRKRIREHCSPRHVPAKIIAVPEIPRTISGKIVELAVRSVIHGRPVRNVDALANPQALEHFKNLPELQEE